MFNLEYCVLTTAQPQKFGKMPLGMREFIKHVMIMKPEGLPGAEAVNSGDVVMVSDKSYKLNILAHEISHSIDSHQEVHGITPAGNGGLSVSRLWREQYSRDNATVSDYARTLWPEKVCCLLISRLFSVSI